MIKKLCPTFAMMSSCSFENALEVAQALSLESPDDPLHSLRTAKCACRARAVWEIARKRLTKPRAIASDNVASRIRLQHVQMCQESIGIGKCARQNPWNYKTKLNDRPVRRSQGSRIEIEPGRYHRRHDEGQQQDANAPS